MRRQHLYKSNPTILFFNMNSSDGNNLKQEIESRERDFFERKMSEHGQPLKAGNNSGLKNPFYDDKNGSMSIYLHEGKWFFNDFGDDKYKGDVFTFAGFVYGLDPHSNFKEILEKMAVDLNISIEESKNGISDSNAINENDYCLTKSPLLSRPTIERTFDDFFEDECNMQPPLGGAACASHQEQLKVEYSEMFDYWYQFGNRDKMNKTLGKFNVRNIKRIQSEKATLEEKPDSPIYGFVFSSDCIKTYAPYEPKDKGKHLWFGEKPDNHVDIFGLNQLPQKGGLLFIVEGYKDCITANANDILSIGVDNASTKIPSQIIADLKNRFTVVVVLYDNDEAGIRASTKIAHEHGLVNLILPKSVNDVEFGKDISDYFAAKLPKERICELATDEASKPNNNISYTEQAKVCEPVANENDLAISKALKQVLENKELINLHVFGKIELPDPILSIGDVGLIYPNTVNVFQGKTGSHKSHLMESLCALMIGKTNSLANIQYTASTDVNVLYVDTERNLTYQYPKAIRKIMQLSFGEVCENDRLDAISLLSLNRNIRVDTLMEYIRASRKTDMHLVVVLDIVTDCIRSFNSVEDSLDLIDVMNQISNEEEVTFLCVIHENPSSVKARGHIGTEISNKASTVIQLEIRQGSKENNNEILKVEFLKTRNSRLPATIYLQYDEKEEQLVKAEDHLVQEYLDSANSKTKPSEIMTHICQNFNAPIERRILIDSICNEFDIKERTAIEKLKFIVENKTRASAPEFASLYLSKETAENRNVHFVLRDRKPLPDAN